MPVHLTSEPLELTALLAETEEPAAGALAIFVGTVRDENEGRRVTGITYEAQPALASRALAAIEQEALARFRIQRCRLVHRTGTLAVGEASVVIVVRSAHRDEAFQALRYAIEELKARVPVWKEEHYEDGRSAYLEGVPLVTEKERLE